MVLCLSCYCQAHYWNTRGLSMTGNLHIFLQFSAFLLVFHSVLKVHYVRIGHLLKSYKGAAYHQSNCYMLLLASSSHLELGNQEAVSVYNASTGTLELDGASWLAC